MIDQELTLNDLVSVAGNPSLFRTDKIIPIEIKGCPPKERWQEPKQHTPGAIAGYTEENECLWGQFVLQHYYEQVCAMREGIIKNLRITTTPIGDLYDLDALAPEETAVQAPISLSLENAFYHGNRNDPTLPVIVKEFQGTRGIIVQIQDSGKGFDVNRVVRKYVELKKAIEVAKKEKDYEKLRGLDRPTEELRYFTRWGRGFSALVTSPFTILFENNGSMVNILYTKEAIMKDKG